MSHAAAVTPKAFNCADQQTPTWLERVHRCVELVSLIRAPKEQALSVADIGCGDQKLKSVLDGLPFEVRYTGYDLLPQHDSTIRFDVRVDPLPGEHHVAVLLGVTEYLDDLAAVLASLSQRVPSLVVSHVIRKGQNYSREDCARLGWVNHLSEDELLAIMSGAGFLLVQSAMTADERTLLGLFQTKGLAQGGGC